MPAASPPGIDGTALVICDGYFDTPVGKTAHGLVRGTDRYRVVGVIDRAHAGRDAGEVLDGKPTGALRFVPNALLEATFEKEVRTTRARLKERLEAGS